MFDGKIRTPDTPDDLKVTAEAFAGWLDDMRREFDRAMVEVTERLQKVYPGSTVRVREVILEQADAVNTALREASTAADELPRRARSVGLAQTSGW